MFTKPYFNFFLSLSCGRVSANASIIIIVTFNLWNNNNILEVREFLKPAMDESFI